MPLRPVSKTLASLCGLALAGLVSGPLLAQQAQETAVAAPSAPASAEGGPTIGNAPSTQPVAPASPDPTAPAEPPPPAEPGASEAADLAALEKTLSLSQERIEALKKEVADMEGDRARQSAALIAAAQRVKQAETDVAAVEERLSDLIVEELEVRGRLDGADAEVSNVLAALERISLSPPPALIVDPSDALGSARGAMLISAIVPQLRARADAVSLDLQKLQDIKSSALAEEATLKANQEVLEEEQLRIATLVAARKLQITQKSAALQAEQAAAEELAKKAGTLRELVEALSARAAAGATSAPATATEPETPRLSPEAIEMAFANAARTEPAVPFELARGYLAEPSNGELVVAYGNNDRLGGISHGQSIVTAPGAQVVAPADGWVLYKGPYLNYGQIVILNTGSGYTTLLAGLDSISVDIGQFVLMGEPLGTMGSRTIGPVMTTSAGNGRPTLYIELRHNNEPFDPQGWWAKNERTG